MWLWTLSKAHGPAGLVGKAYRVLINKPPPSIRIIIRTLEVKVKALTERACRSASTPDLNASGMPSESSSAWCRLAFLSSRRTLRVTRYGSWVWGFSWFWGHQCSQKITGWVPGSWVSASARMTPSVAKDLPKTETINPKPQTHSTFPVLLLFAPCLVILAEAKAEVGVRMLTAQGFGIRTKRFRVRVPCMLDLGLNTECAPTKCYVCPVLQAP